MSPPPRPTKTRWNVVPTRPATGLTESGGGVGGGVGGGGVGATVGRGVGGRVAGPGVPTGAWVAGSADAAGEAAAGADGAPEPAPLGRALALGVPDGVVPATELPAPPNCVTPSTIPPMTSTATAIAAAVFVGKGCSMGLRNPASLFTRSPSGTPA